MALFLWLAARVGKSGRMWWIIAAVIVAWALLPLPSAVAVGRAFAAAEPAEQPEPRVLQPV